ncbi:MAG: flotillin-like protein FloA [Verrucomicrobia bacterium]|nr:flotillin-like protein FloA [Verrucomicrobiota bacterium]
MSLSLILLVIAGIIVLVVGAVIFSLIGAWVKALFNGAAVPMSKLVALKLASIPYSLIVDARITAVRAGINISADQIASHFQAGGNVVPTVQALIAAQKAGITLDWDRACAIDLATKGSGKSVVEAVRTSVDPKVIDCPNPESGRTTIDGVAKDGIQVKVKARVTVRTHLDRFVGGAKEETIIARVGEGIVSTIGTADSYKVVLEAPDSISKTVLARGLDVGSAFEILSIDIADVDVGENVGAKLQQAQAEANKSVAQAQAEIRRAAAVALEQEMKARVQEMQAEVVRAQSEVPKAMADAFRSGRLGVMDYYKMENIQSDTSMRQSIARPDEKK